MVICVHSHSVPRPSATADAGERDSGRWLRIKRDGRRSWSATKIARIVVASAGRGVGAAFRRAPVERRRGWSRPSGPKPARTETRVALLYGRGLDGGLVGAPGVGTTPGLPSPCRFRALRRRRCSMRFSKPKTATRPASAARAPTPAAARSGLPISGSPAAGATTTCTSMWVEAGALTSSWRSSRIACALAATCVAMSCAARGLGPVPLMKMNGPDCSSSGFEVPLLTSYVVVSPGCTPSASEVSRLRSCWMTSDAVRPRLWSKFIIGLVTESLWSVDSYSVPPLSGVVSTSTLPDSNWIGTPEGDTGQHQGGEERGQGDVPAAEQDHDGPPEVHGASPGRCRGTVDGAHGHRRLDLPFTFSGRRGGRCSACDRSAPCRHGRHGRHGRPDHSGGPWPRRRPVPGCAGTVSRRSSARAPSRPPAGSHPGTPVRVRGARAGGGSVGRRTAGAAVARVRRRPRLTVRK